MITLPIDTGGSVYLKQSDRMIFRLNGCTFRRWVGSPLTRGSKQLPKPSKPGKIIGFSQDGVSKSFTNQARCVSRYGQGQDDRCQFFGKSESGLV